MRKITLKFLVLCMAICSALFVFTACGGVDFKINFVVDSETYAVVNTNGAETIKMPDNPVKDNYIFDGWFWDKDTWEKPFTANSLLDAPLSSDMSVYCKWKNNDINGIVFNDVETTYDGSEKTIEVSGLLEGATVTYDNPNTYTNAGTYIITATVKKANYNDLQLTATLTIKKATYDLSSIAFNDVSVTYDGQKHNVEIEGQLPSGVSVAYENNGKINAGNYAVIAKFSGDNANYEPIINKSATLTINKAVYDLSGVVFSNKEITYNGEAQSIIIEGQLPNGVNVSYENNGKINAGEYTIKAVFSGDNVNYEPIENKTATLTIIKANYDMSAVVFEDKTVTYDGNSNSIEATNVPYGLSVSYSGNSKTNVGTYNVTASFSDTTGNYFNPTDKNATLIINKAVPTGIKFENKAFTYDKQAHSLCVEGLPDGISVSYTNNDKVNADSYTVIASFEDVSGNYFIPEDMSAKLIINKAPVSDIVFENKTFTYNGTKRSLAISGTLPDEVSVAYVNNDKINANVYTVTAIFDCESENYVVPDDMTAVLTIKKAIYDMSSVEFENKSVVYDGTAQSVNISGTLPTGVTVNYTNNNQSSAGQYVVTAIFEGDIINYYAIDDMQAMLTIQKATYDMSGVSFVGGKYTYDGTEKSIGISGTLPDGVTVNYTNNAKINAGNYTVIATFTGDNQNYNKLSEWTASLIIDKATYDMSGVSFKNQTFTYDGTNKNAVVSGSLPSGVSVSYLGNEKIEVGSYSVTAKFSGDVNNYNSITDMTATLKINQAVPYIKEVGCAQTLTIYSTVELIADTTVSGTILFDEGQTLTLGVKNYSWTFIPEDSHNYTNATGTVGLTVCALVSYYNENVLFDSQNIALNNSATLPINTPEKADDNGLRYSFVYWSIQENGAEYNFTDAVTDNIQLFAVYDSEEIVYTINYFDTKNVENLNRTTYTVSNQFSLMPIEKEYYVFENWQDENGKTIDTITAGTFGDLKLYAKWSFVEFNITYDLGYRGVENINNPLTYNIESAFNFVAPTYDEYHTFAGWFLEKNYANQKSQVLAGETGEILLYAKWNFSGTYISNVSELQAIAYNMSGIYELKNDIDLDDYDWVTIGSEEYPFTGYLNGADCRIINATKPIFRVSSGMLKNINLANINIRANGSLAVINKGYILNSEITGSILGSQYTGGITGNNFGTILYCKSNCEISGNIGFSSSEVSNIYIGGIAGYNSGKIEFCSVNNSIDISIGAYNCYKAIYGYIGGITGYSSGTINACSFIGSICCSCLNSTSTGYSPAPGQYETYDSNIYIGGIVGYSDNDISNCYSILDSVTASSKNRPTFGGIVGRVYDKKTIINNCYAIINKTTMKMSNYGDASLNAGGIIGVATANLTLKNCVSIGMSLDNSSATLINSYNETELELQASDYIANVLHWGIYTNMPEVANGNVWITVNGILPKLFFE